MTEPSTRSSSPVVERVNDPSDADEVVRAMTEARQEIVLADFEDDGHRVGCRFPRERCDCGRTLYAIAAKAQRLAEGYAAEMDRKWREKYDPTERMSVETFRERKADEHHSPGPAEKVLIGCDECGGRVRWVHEGRSSDVRLCDRHGSIYAGVNGWTEVR